MFDPRRILRFFVIGGLCAGLCVVVSPSLAASAAGAFHEGTVAASQLSWDLDGTGAYAPSLPGARRLAETDKPVLVSQSLLLLVPVDLPVSGVVVEPLATHRERVPGKLSQGGLLYDDQGVGKVVDRLAGGKESGEGSYPQVWGEYGGSHLWRGFRLVAVQLYPLRALRDGTDGWTEVEVLDRYAVRLQTEAGGTSPVVTVRERLVPGERLRLESQLRGLVANPEALAGYARQDGVAVAEPAGGFQPSKTPSLGGSAVRYLIITDSSLESEFQVLADHKTALGMPAVVKTVDWITANYRHGCDIQETIRHFIRESYERWGVEFVLLGGDSDLLPARFATSTYHPPQGTTDIPSDLYFSCLDGNWNDDGDYVFGEPYTHYLYPGDECDMANELDIGRAPVSTAAAATVFVDKTITYETATSADGNYKGLLFLAEVLFPSEYTPGDYIILDGASFAENIYNDFVLPCTSMDVVRMYEAYALTDTLGNPIYPGSWT